MLRQKTPLKSRKKLESRAGLKSTKPLKPGKKYYEWETVKKELKIKFKTLGIIKCEANLDGCWKAKGLTFAHLQKRRFLTEETLTEVVLCCIECHQKIESYTHEIMYNYLKAIINNRGTYDKSS